MSGSFRSENVRGWRATGRLLVGLAVVLTVGLAGLAQPVAASSAGAATEPEVTRGVQLFDVDCVSTSVCFAVGVNRYRERLVVGEDDVENTVKDRPLVAVKTAGGWSEMNFPAIPQGRAELFTSAEADEVSCVPTAKRVSLRNTYCVVTGDYRDFSTRANDYSEQGPMTAVWNGTRWRLLEKPLPLNVEPTEHVDVECVAAKTCYSLIKEPRGPNNFEFGTWNGKRWISSEITKPDDHGLGEVGTRYMESLSCWAVRRCLATGGERVNQPRRYRAVSALLDGKKWHVNHLPGEAFGAVDCPTATRCVVVGQGESKIGNPRSGKWRVVSMRGTQGQFGEVACATATSCLAVGYAGDLRAAQQLTGRRWTSATPPSLETGRASLTGVTCPQAKLCFATGGQYGLDDASDVLLERRNGTWRKVTVAVEPYQPPA